MFHVKHSNAENQKNIASMWALRQWNFIYALLTLELSRASVTRVSQLITIKLWRCRAGLAGTHFDLSGRRAHPA